MAMFNSYVSHYQRVFEKSIDFFGDPNGGNRATPGKSLAFRAEKSSSLHSFQFNKVPG